MREAAEVPDLRARILQLRDLVGESAEMTAVLAGLERTYEDLRIAAEEIRTQEQEIQRLLASQQLMRWQQQRVQQMLPVAVVTTDLGGVVNAANAAAVALFGVDMVHLVRADLFGFVAGEDSSSLRGTLAGLAGGSRVRRTVSVVARDGRVTPVEVSAATGSPHAREISWVFVTPAPPDPSERGDEIALSEALVALAALPASIRAEPGLLRRAVEICREALGDDIALSLNIGAPTAPAGVASSAAVAQAADGAQLSAEDGPSVRAFDRRRTVVSGHLATDARWPTLAADPRLPHVGAVAVPLLVGDELFGVLSAYGDVGDPPHGGIVRSVEMLGAAVAAVLHEANVRQELERESAELESALQSRAIIDQAKGIVMAERSCSAEEAFEHLVQLSSTQHTKLRDVARQLVEQRTTGGAGAG